jgi:hypothetical protein
MARSLSSRTRSAQANDAPIEQFEQPGLTKEYEAYLKKGKEEIAEL